MTKKSIIVTSFFLLFTICYLLFTIFLLPSSHLSVKAMFICNGSGADYCGYPPDDDDETEKHDPNPTSAPSGKQNCKCFNAQGVMVRDTCVDCGSSCGDAPAGGWCELQGNCGECRVCIF